MKRIDWYSVLTWLFVLAAIALSIYIPYLIATSDLPEAFKFWLLK